MNSKSQPGTRAPGKGAQDTAKGLDDAQILKLKEDLYCDLTGLMIHGVKRVDGEDVFDCIQTGKNGSECLASLLGIVANFAALRFNLSIEEQSTATAAPSSYESAQMYYMPVFDEKNDQRLLSVLEDFLREEICFPRSHGQGFYTKVLECMMRRVELVD